MVTLRQARGLYQIMFMAWLELPTDGMALFNEDTGEEDQVLNY